jgi:hypothetical protein
MKFSLYFALLLCICAATSLAQSGPVAAIPTSTPSDKKSATAEGPIPSDPEALVAEKNKPAGLRKFDKAPVIDGILDDEIWKTATVFKDFVQVSPGDNNAPTNPTEARIGYDSKTLYLAFHCFEPRDKVQATVAKRDDVFGDDNIRVLLDTFNDQRKAYVLVFNPLGVQEDGIRTEGTGVDFSVDIVMESKGVLTEDGFTIEVAIPFKSLRYEAGKGKIWGLHIFRQIQYMNNEGDSWMPLVRGVSTLLSQTGHLTGLEGISTERTLEIIPSVTVAETGVRAPSFFAQPNDPGRILNGPLKLDLGASIKYQITPTVTLDAAINPDFAQVEADTPVVLANQRFPIFFAEKRPFFLEGKDIFDTPLQLLNTRTIVDPDVAAKLSGKIGRTSFGLMFASDAAPDQLSRGLSFLSKNANSAVLRVKRDVGKQNSIGFEATTFSYANRHNQVLSIDGRFLPSSTITAQFQVVGTTSRRFFFDPDTGTVPYRTGNGFGYTANISRNSRHWFVQAAGGGRSRDYRADLGFTPRTNTNTEVFFWEYDSTPNQKNKFVGWGANSNNSIRYDWHGHTQGWAGGVRVYANFRKQGFLTVGFDNYYERVFEGEFGTRRSIALPCDPLGQSGLIPGCTFYGQPERSSNDKSISFGGNITPSKQWFLAFSGSLDHGSLDYDFGGGPKFPRVSPAALLGLDQLDPGAGKGLNLNASVVFKPSDPWQISLDYTKSRLRRYDTGLVAFDDNIYSLRSTYQFTRFTFVRARIDYDSLAANVKGQFLLGWTPNPGTAFYVGYNDDMNYNGFGPFTGHLEPGLRRNGRSFFIKASYLFRRSLG